jgi:hypothetical protein
MPRAVGQVTRRHGHRWSPFSTPSQEEARGLEALLDDFRQSLVSQGKSTDLVLGLHAY